MDKVIAVLPTGEWAELTPGQGVEIMQVGPWELEDLGTGDQDVSEVGTILGGWVRDPDGVLEGYVMRDGQPRGVQALDPLNTGTGPVHILHRDAVLLQMVCGERSTADPCLCHRHRCDCGHRFAKAIDWNAHVGTCSPLSSPPIGVT